MTKTLERRTIMQSNSFLAAAIAAVALAATPSIGASTPARAGGSASRADRASTGPTRIILLGTNGGPSANPLRSEPANLLVVDGVSYLIDAGSGAARQIDTPDGSVVFTGDTGPSHTVTELARNADVPVSEVCLCDSPARVHPTTTSAVGARTAAALERQETFHMLHEHLTPEDVGKLAAAAHVKVVILTHFVPGDGTIDPTRFTAGVMKYFPGPVIPARDLFEYDLR